MELFGNDLLKPFDISVWIALIVMIALFIVGLKVMQKYHHSDTENSSSFVITFGAYCQQGSHSIYQYLSPNLGNLRQFSQYFPELGIFFLLLKIVQSLVLKAVSNF